MNRNLCNVAIKLQPTATSRFHVEATGSVPVVHVELLESCALNFGCHVLARIIYCTAACEIKELAIAEFTEVNRSSWVGERRL